MPIHRPANLPKFSWEALRVHDDLGTIEGTVTEGAILAHAFAIGENPAPYLEGFQNLGPIVPPSLLVNDLLKMFLVGYDCTEVGSAGGLHTRALITYHAPLSVGAPVEISGSHIAKFVRNGRRNRSVLSRVTSGGQLIAEMLATETVGYTNDNGPDAGDMPANWAANLPRVSHEIPPGSRTAVPGQPVEDGMVIGPVRRWVGLEQCMLFSGFPFVWAQERGAMRVGLHTSFEVAKKAGYPVPVVQGLMSMGHLSAMLLRQYGGKFFHGTRFALNFVSPLLSETSLRSHAVALPNTLDGAQDTQLLSLISYDEQGQIKTAGYAQVAR